MRQLALIALLLFAAAAIWYFSESPTERESSQNEIQTDEPDVYGKNIELTQFHPDGSLHYRMRAQSIRQYNVEELTRMTAPDLHLVSPERPPWDVQSNHGYIRTRPGPSGEPEEVVYLREDVRMVQNHPENGLITMRSEAFYIYPDREYAETDQDVMIDTEVGRTKAGGMRANLESGLLELSSGNSSRVHTIVLPEQFKKT